MNNDTTENPFDSTKVAFIQLDNRALKNPWLAELYMDNVHYRTMQGFRTMAVCRAACMMLDFEVVQTDPEFKPVVDPVIKPQRLNKV